MRKKLEKGVLTVETALLLPALISVILFFLHFFRILWVEQQLYHAAFDVMQDASACGYLFKYADTKLEQKFEQYADKEYMEMLEIAADIFRASGSSTWFNTAIERRLSNPQLVEKTIFGGLDGISFQGSDIYAEDEMTTICINYKIKFPVFCDILPVLSFEKKFLVRSFSGEGQLELELGSDKEDDSEETKEEGYVYVTKSGTVYHVNSSCSYIKFNLISCAFEKIEEQRNNSGGRYYACDACAKQSGEVDTVWITKNGTHYHTKRQCNKIHRDIRKITLAEAGGYRPCSRCAANGI